MTMTNVTFGRRKLPPGGWPEKTKPPSRSIVTRLFSANLALCSGLVLMPVVIAVGYLVEWVGQVGPLKP